MLGWHGAHVCPWRRRAQTDVGSFRVFRVFSAVQVFTYNGQDWGEEGHATQGGYSNTYTIDSKCADPARVLVLGF